VAKKRALFFLESDETLCERLILKDKHLPSHVIIGGVLLYRVITLEFNFTDQDQNADERLSLCIYLTGNLFLSGLKLSDFIQNLDQELFLNILEFLVNFDDLPRLLFLMTERGNGFSETPVEIIDTESFLDSW
jgi:hypothetical protein